MNQIVKTKAFAFFENEDMIFVFEMRDDSTGELKYRPVGGSVEFGEYAVNALHREIMEELNTEISICSAAQVVESIYLHNDKKGHEVVFIFDARFKDPTFYELKNYDIVELDGEKFTAKWYPKLDFIMGKRKLIPEVLLDKIKK